MSQKDNLPVACLCEVYLLSFTPSYPFSCLPILSSFPAYPFPILIPQPPPHHIPFLSIYNASRPLPVTSVYHYALSTLLLNHLTPTFHLHPHLNSLSTPTSILSLPYLNHIPSLPLHTPTSIPAHPIPSPPNTIYDQIFGSP